MRTALLLLALGLLLRTMHKARKARRVSDSWLRDLDRREDRTLPEGPRWPWEKWDKQW